MPPSGSPPFNASELGLMRAYFRANLNYQNTGATLASPSATSPSGFSYRSARGRYPIRKRPIHCSSLKIQPHFSSKIRLGSRCCPQQPCSAGKLDRLFITKPTPLELRHALFSMDRRSLPIVPMTMTMFCKSMQFGLSVVRPTAIPTALTCASVCKHIQKHIHTNPRSSVLLKQQMTIHSLQTLTIQNPSLS